MDVNFEDMILQSPCPDLPEYMSLTAFSPSLLFHLRPSASICVHLWLIFSFRSYARGNFACLSRAVFGLTRRAGSAWVATRRWRKSMDYSSKIAKHVASIPRSGIRDFFDLVVGRDDVISLGVGEPDFVTPWHIREAAIYSLEKGQTTYTANLGLLSLRKSISKYVSGFFEVDYDPAKEILVTVGVSEAIDIALRALLNPGDEVI